MKTEYSDLISVFSVEACNDCSIVSICISNIPEQFLKELKKELVGEFVALFKKLVDIRNNSEDDVTVVAKRKGRPSKNQIVIPRLIPRKRGRPSQKMLN